MPQQQASQYDKIFRENLEAVIPSLIKNLLGIDAVASEELPDDIQHTKERKPDALKKITDATGNTFVLHLEFQLADETDMVFRMAEYYIMLRRQNRLPVRQYVLFLGDDTPKMPVALSEEMMQFRFTLIPFASVDYSLFVSSQKPEEIILGILGNFQNEASDVVIGKIINRLSEYSDSTLNYNRYTNQLRILAQMRNLASQIDFVMDSILPFLDEKKDIFYVAGKFEVYEKVIIELLKQTNFSDEKIADITGATIETIQKVRIKHQLN